jgi:hypothetical protein
VLFRSARVIAAAGIYDLPILLEHVLVPVILGHWRLKELEGLTPQAEAAREKVLHHLERLGRIVARQTERRADASVRAEAGSQLSAIA